MDYVGRSGNKLLYTDDVSAVVVDEKTNLVLSIDEKEALVASASWDASEEEPAGSAHELAKAAIAELDIKVFSDSDRMYTIPKGVVAEAKRGLKWRKEEGRGGTKVGMSTARLLAKGGQIGLKKVKHIANYFPRHEYYQKYEGYRPGEEGYPSNSRIAWALWGGDAGQRWATAIKEREEKKEKNASVIASLYEEFYGEEKVDYNSFSHSGEQGSFYMRLNLRNGKIDRLYIVSPEGDCKVWDDGTWDDMGNVEYDFAAYDAELDDPNDKDERAYVLVDRETAITVSAFFDENPMGATELRSINYEETELFESAMPELDWESLDQFNDETVDYLDELSEEEDLIDDEDSLVAAVTEFAEDEDTTPGEYTEEERSEAASKQVRDKLGRFAETGSRVVIAGRQEYQGNITAQDSENKTVTVELDNGNSVTVPGNTTQEVSTFEPIPQRDLPESNLDFSGILGEPRVPIDQPNAKLPGRLPPLTASDVNTLVDDWGSWVADQRLSPEYDGDPVEPVTYKDPPDMNTAFGKYYDGAFNPDGTAKPGWNPATAENVYNEPLLRDWLDEKYGNKSGIGQGQTYAGGWYRGKTYDGVDIEEKKSRDEVVSDENKARYDDKYDIYNFSVTAAAEGEEKLTPETSDVAPMYLAIVADDDPQAVMNLVALVPANKKSIRPTAFIREPGKWTRDDSVVADLNSPTPPPVVVLDNENLSEVTMQIDGDKATVASAMNFWAHLAQTNNRTISALVAAGGADRNRGNAENLRRYWTTGKGGLKIRWNTPGDWTRCNRQLKKYMGPRAKGYCALRHKEMTGVWPGDKKNVGKKNASIMASGAPDTDNTLRSEEEIIEMSTLRARALSAKAKVSGRHSVAPKKHGAKFVIPLVIPEEAETGDGRIFQKDSISMRDLPLPLLWQIKTGNGHDGSVVVGQITHMERVQNGIGNAVGVFDTGEFGQEAERLVRHGFIRGVSADMDKFEADEEELPEEAGEDSEKVGSGRINITSARVMAVTVVPKPAFQECYIQIVDDNDYEEETMQPDGVYVDDMNPLDASALVACGMVADAIPMHPPVDWFGDPKLKKATPLTITDDGRVFGHIAAWHVDHIGMNFGTKPPRSRSKYSYFHTGVVKTSEGQDVEVGQLTLAGGHAGLEADAVAAAKHYDDTASAFADVHAGEDAYGIWVAGSLRPGTTPDMVRAARASAPSGDWRPIKGSLELVAVCQVNVPGFPIARARVASGQVMALVAAGSSVLAQMKSDPIKDLSDKVASLEAAQLSPKLEEAKARFAVHQEERREEYRAQMEELAAKVKDPLKKDREDEEDESWEYMIQMMDGPTETAIIPRRVRRRLAREGKALPDGSFPIRSVSDLRTAIRAYDRAEIGNRGRVQKHIMRRAKSLDRPDLVPPRWSTSYKEAASIDEFKDYSEETREKYAKEGKALPDGSFPIANVEDLKRAIKAHGRAKDIAKAKAHIKKRARALDSKDLIPDEWKNASLDEKSLEIRAVAELAVEYRNLEALFSEEALVAAPVSAEDIARLDDAEIEAIRQEAQENMRKADEAERIKYTPETQPRDEQGKFRKVLARLKGDLGQSGLDNVIKKVEEAENLTFAGDYDRATQAAEDLIGIIDRLDAKALNPEALENVRDSAGELGKVIANLPFAFGQDTEKIRYSDVPPVLQKLMEDMIERVEDKIGPEDADVATADLKNFMSGGDYFSQADISSEMSKLLRLLT